MLCQTSSEEHFGLNFGEGHLGETDRPSKEIAGETLLVPSCSTPFLTDCGVTEMINVTVNNHC